LGIITEEKDLCAHCFDYNQILVKKKEQHEMGRRFQCRWPQAGVDITMQNQEVGAGRRRNHNAGSNTNSTEKEGCDEKEVSHAKRARPHDYKKSCAALKDKLSQAEENLAMARKKRDEERNEIDAEMEILRLENTKLQDVITELKAEIVKKDQLRKRADEKATAAITNERKAYGKLSEFKKSRGVKGNETPDPVESCNALIKVLSDGGTPDNEIADGFLSALCQKKKVKQHIVTAVLDSAIGKDVKAEVETAMYERIQDKFAPWKCLLHLDLEASVSYRGLNVIRKIEFYGDEKTKYRRGIISERSKLSRIARDLENYGKDFLPYTLTKTSVQFDIEKCTTYLLKKFQLWDHVMAKEDGILAATVDGGQLAWKITQISAGLKIIDPRSINPRTGELLFGESGADNIQSSIHCFPLYVHIAKDNKDFYNTHLTGFFSSFNRMEDEHIGGLRLAYPADMCSQVKTVRSGGAMKLSNYACYCCGVHKHDLAKPNEVLCEDCTRLGNTVCYHHPVLVEELLESFKVELEDLKSEWAHLKHFPFKNSKIKSGTTGESTADPRHIEYEPRSIQQRMVHNRMIEEELRMRDINIDNLSGPERRLLLHEVLIMEQRYSIIKGVLEAKNEDRMILIEKAIPCLLHLENRISEAIIRLILLRALHFFEDDTHATAEFILEVERYVNEKIFGEPDAPSGWKFPYEEKRLGEVKFSNWRARRIIEEFDGLADLCIPETELELRQQWKGIATQYLEVIRLLRRKKNFNSSQIDAFQQKADSFFINWLALVGYDGITNYVHMLGAGHIRFFLRKWGSLYRLQNQGWEQYNGRVAAFWHHRTSKGGSKYDKSKILPIAKWLLRLMLWKTGEGENYFINVKEDQRFSYEDGSSSDSDDDP
jgi:hypothetical protein